jgi:hypothetical protein
MDAEAQERFARQVADAWLWGDEDRMRQLCRRYDVSFDPADPLKKVTINAVPSQMHSETVEFTIVKEAA